MRMRIPINAALALLLVHSPMLAMPSQQVEVFDIVLAGGRVMDPESGLDAVRNVGINANLIVAITSQPLTGRTTIDARGLVVAPGFVDLHAHGQDSISSRFQAADGVTTGLELEGGTNQVGGFYTRKTGRAIINFGATVSHGGIRQVVLTDTVAMGPAAVYRAATPEEVARMQTMIRRGLDDGAIGIGYGIQYVPGARREEILETFQTAAEYGVTNFVHDRYAGLMEPGSSVEAVQEMIADAAITGASVHVVHIGSSGLSAVPLLIEMIEGAQSRGIDITTEVYPYTAASTDIRAAIFSFPKMPSLMLLLTHW